MQQLYRSKYICKLKDDHIFIFLKKCYNFIFFYYLLTFAIEKNDKLFFITNVFFMGHFKSPIVSFPLLC